MDESGIKQWIARKRAGMDIIQKGGNVQRRVSKAGFRHISREHSAARNVVI